MAPMHCSIYSHANAPAHCHNDTSSTKTLLPTSPKAFIFEFELPLFLGYNEYEVTAQAQSVRRLNHEEIIWFI